MHSIHLRDFHLPKNPNLFLLSVGEVVWFSIALLFFLLSWAVGGEEFKESIGGNLGLAGLLLGLALGAVFCAITRPKQ